MLLLVSRPSQRKGKRFPISVHPSFTKRVQYECIKLNMIDTHDMERLGQIYLLMCKWPICILRYSHLPQELFLSVSELDYAQISAFSFSKVAYMQMPIVSWCGSPTLNHKNYQLSYSFYSALWMLTCALFYSLISVALCEEGQILHYKCGQPSIL